VSLTTAKSNPNSPVYLETVFTVLMTQFSSLKMYNMYINHTRSISVVDPNSDTKESKILAGSEYEKNVGFEFEPRHCY
jgi:hypothetical protein